MNEYLDFIDQRLLSYVFAVVIFIALMILMRVISTWLDERYDREFNELIKELEENIDHYPDMSRDARAEEIDIVKEALQEAYDLGDEDKVVILGNILKQLRKL